MNRPRDTVGARLSAIAHEHGGQPAVVSLDASLSYGELDERSSAGAAALVASGHAPGRSTALVASGMDYIIAYFAIARAANRVVPIESRFRGAQLARIIDSAQVSLAVVDGAGRQAFEGMTAAPPLIDVTRLAVQPVTDAALPSVDGDSELCVLFSSGSTGFPKGVVLQHAAGVGRAELMARVYGAGKRHLVMTPLAYAYGLIDGILCPLLHGGRTLLLEGYQPGRLKEMVRREAPEIFLGVPFVYKHLATMRADLLAGLPQASSCLYYTTGEPLPRATQVAFEARYGVPIRQNYGLSEVSAIAADLHGTVPKPRRVGKVLPGVEIRLVEDGDGEHADADVGEIWVERSHRFMRGYVDGSEDAAARMAQDCYRTGDIGRIDRDGYLELLGRNDDFVTVAGVRIHPAEIENVLLSVPGVVEAAYVCRRDRETGDQSTTGYVVLAPGTRFEPAALDAAMRAQLPVSHVPHRIERSAGLPRTDTGKLARRRLVDGADERLVATAPVIVDVAGTKRRARLTDVSRNGCTIALAEPLEPSLPTSVALAADPAVSVDGVVAAPPRDETGATILFTAGADPAIVEQLIARRDPPD